MGAYFVQEIGKDEMGNPSGYKVVEKIDKRPPIHRGQFLGDYRMHGSLARALDNAHGLLKGLQAQRSNPKVRERSLGRKR